MNDSLFSTKDMVKYLIIAGLVYAILKMIPSVQLADKDLMLLLAIITVGFVCLDCLFLKKTEGFANEDPFTLDLNTDINELIEQRKSKITSRQESLSTISEKITPEEAQRQEILSRLEEKTSDPIRIAKEEIKKLDEQISNAFSGADAAIAKKAKAEVETKLEILKAKELTTEESDKVSKIRQELALGEERKRVVIDESIMLPELEDVTRTLPKTSCGMEVEKIKRQMEDQLTELKEQLQARASIPPSSAKIANRYFESLMNDLADKGILDAAEIDNIQAKLRTKLLSMDEVIASLETLKQEGKSKVRVQDGKVKHDRDYSELPSDFYVPLGQQVPNEWTSEYTILNTNKWQVPMPRPPVCINTQPCKVCPSDSSSNSTNLKQWDDSRYVTGGKINKKWAEDQNSA